MNDKNFPARGFLPRKRVNLIVKMKMEVRACALNEHFSVRKMKSCLL